MALEREFERDEVQAGRNHQVGLVGQRTVQRDRRRDRHAADCGARGPREPKLGLLARAQHRGLSVREHHVNRWVRVELERLRDLEVELLPGIQDLERQMKSVIDLEDLPV